MLRQIIDQINGGKLIKVLYSHIATYATPSNLNWIWSFGAMAGLMLFLQFATGFFLGCNFTANVEWAFPSITYIMEDVPHGYLIRYLHANGASAFFIVVYAHIAKALFYGSYFKPRNYLWYTGVLIFILMMATAFIGYVLPWGQMSLWGATVITSLFTSIPKIGYELCTLLWGGYTVGNPTLQKFAMMHYILPSIIAGLVVIHIAILHAIGSNNPTGIEKPTLINFFPSFGIKDLAAGLISCIFLGVVLALHPNAFGHPDNDIPAQIYLTPLHIVPEWYFLPFYAILRSIPHKLGGVIAMFASILILFFVPHLNTSKYRNSSFNLYYSRYYFLFLLNLLFLAWVGQLPAESPFVVVGMFGTYYYFYFFLAVLPRANLSDR